jgi:hypothetical protein
MRLILEKTISVYLFLISLKRLSVAQNRARIVINKLSVGEFMEGSGT